MNIDFTTRPKTFRSDIFVFHMFTWLAVESDVTGNIN